MIVDRKIDQELIYCLLVDSDSPVRSELPYSKPVSDKPDEFSVDTLKREVSEGSSQDGSVGSGLG